MKTVKRFKTKKLKEFRITLYNNGTYGIFMGNMSLSKTEYTSIDNAKQSLINGLNNHDLTKL